MAELMFIVEKDGDNAILRASQCPDFASFLAAIRSKFTDLLSNDFPLKFVLEPKQLSSVKSQQDFENVILLCKNLQRCVVNLTIAGYVSTDNSGTTTRKENAPTEGQNPKRKLPEEERNEGECGTSPIQLCDVDPQQDSRSLQNAPTEVNRSKRKLPEEETNGGDCATSSVPLCDVAPEEDSGSPLNAPSKGKKSKRKLPEEERNGGECETSPSPLHNIAPEQDSRSLQTAPTEKQKSMRNIPAEERNQGECATLPITLYEVAPQQDSRSLQNASAEKQKSKRKLLEEIRNEDECSTSPTTLSIAAPQQGGRSLLNADWVNKITHVGQEFRGGVADFRCQLAKYATKMGFKYKYSRNDARYITAYCSELDKEGCKWYVKGGIDTINKSSFVIRRANLVHTCTLSVMGNGSHRLGAHILGNLVQEKVQNNPKLGATQIRDHLLNDYGLDVTYEQVWRGLEVAKANVLGFGSYKDSYTELHWYKSAILKTNPGSHVTLETEEDTNRFKRFFVAFKGSLQGFEKCRPMLFVDATSLKKRCKGTFLSATAKDGNDGIFPVAFAIVDSENGNNWIWFLSMLRDIIKHEKEIMYLSDRAGGLLAAFNMVWERPLHFFCLDHLMKYLRGMYKGKKYSDVFKNKMCKLLKDAAYAPNPCLFSTAIAEFQRQGGEITGQFLTDLPVEKWALAFAPDLLRYGELKSNDEESVNNWILDACSSPITYVLDCISTQLVKLFLERREEQRKWTGALTPRMEEMWNALDMLSSSWMISSTTFEGVFSVLSRPPCKVDLNRQICTCYQWQITGFPCCHAVACIKQAGWNIRGVVDASFLNDTYKLIYESDIEAIPPTTEKNEYMELNTNPCILPPVIRKDQEKPSKKRTPSKGEDKKMKTRCGRCGEFGTHHWVTCMDA